MWKMVPRSRHFRAAGREDYEGRRAVARLRHRRGRESSTLRTMCGCDSCKVWPWRAAARTRGPVRFSKNCGRKKISTKKRSACWPAPTRMPRPREDARGSAPIPAESRGDLRGSLSNQRRLLDRHQRRHDRAFGREESRRRRSWPARSASPVCANSNARASDKYWLLATLGEAALIARDWSQAAEWYTQARRARPKRFGDLQSSRRNARLLLDYWKADPARLNVPYKFRRARVRRPHDRPTRTRASSLSLPTLEEPVAAEIERAHRKHRRAAQLFIRRLRIGPSFSRSDARVRRRDRGRAARTGASSSCAIAWMSFLGQGIGVFVSNVCWQKRPASSRASTDRFGRGGVLLRLRQPSDPRTGQHPRPAIGNRTDAPGRLGRSERRWTRRHRQRGQDWRRTGLDVEVIDLPRHLQPTGRARTNSAPRPTKAEPREFPSRIMSMLFADAVSFSSLTEPQVPLFVEHFLGAIGRLVAAAGRRNRREKHLGRRNLSGLRERRGRRETCARSLRCRQLRAVEKIRPAGEFESAHRAPRWPGLLLHRSDHTEARLRRHPRQPRRSASNPSRPAGQVYASEAFAALAAAQGVTRLCLRLCGPDADGERLRHVSHLSRSASLKCPAPPRTSLKPAAAP